MKDALDVLGTRPCRVEKKSADELFTVIPEPIRAKAAAAVANLPPGISELELDRRMDELLAKNKIYRNFVGAGAYGHYIPAAVSQVLSRGEYVTPYTPYQAEVSQGILQALFEYQTVVSEITGLDVANASMYDAGSALAEAVLLCSRKAPDRKKIILFSEINPYFLEVARTYTHARDFVWHRTAVQSEVEPMASDPNLLCVIVQQPDFRGTVSDFSWLASLKKTNPSIKIIYLFEPLSAILLRSPADCGADLAIGEGLGCGIPLSYGGPGLGLFAARREYLRDMPGRLVGLTRDAAGNRAFTLTLQTREQHIRREKATSNICTNQTLNAIGFLMFMAYHGAAGLKRLAEENYNRAHYLASLITKIFGVTILSGTFYNEFCLGFKPGHTPDAVIAAMKNDGINPGLAVSNGLLVGHSLPSMALGGTSNILLVAVTELCSESDCRDYAVSLARTVGS